MSKYDEKYEAAGAEAATSHVRGIIQQLNDEKPSQEKSREVVVRPDGTKVVRVTKKRRVVVSEDAKRKAGRRSFMLILLGFFLLCFGGIGVLLFRMSQMSGEAYIQTRADELKQAWGAESVLLSGSGVDGISFHLSGIIAEFPADSPIRRVELTDISADLDTSTFFSGVLSTEKMTVKRAEIVLNPDLQEMKMPLAQGETLWKIRSIECADFNVSMGDTMSLKNVRASMYHPHPSDKVASSLVLSGGTLALRGMQPIRLADSEMLLTARGAEFSLNGTTDRPNQDAGKLSTSLTISGRMPVGAPLAGPYELDSENMPLSAFTYGRFGDILKAKTVRQAVGNEHTAARILLPIQQPSPVYSGEFRLKEISLSGFPAQTLVLKHLEDERRAPYYSPVIQTGSVRLQADAQNVRIEFPEDLVSERDFMSLSGEMTVDGENSLSGTLNIGLPAFLTHAEYIDGKPDPIFRESLDTAWVTIELSGTVNVPADNFAMLEAQAEEARHSRPERMNLDEMNVGKIAEQLDRDRATLDEADRLDSAPQPSAPESESHTDYLDEELQTPPARGSLDMSSPLDTPKLGL